MTLDQTTAAEAVDSVPPPAETRALAARLDHTSQQLLTVLQATLPIAAAPLLAAGTIVAGLVVGLDPIVFGVIPAGNLVSGEPAVWHILAQ